MTEIYLVLATIIKYNISKRVKKTEGVIPHPKDYFNHFLEDEDKKILDKVRLEFEKKYPSNNKPIHASIAPNDVVTAWYNHLDVYSKSNIEMIKERKLME